MDGFILLEKTDCDKVSPDLFDKLVKNDCYWLGVYAESVYRSQATTPMHLRTYEWDKIRQFLVGHEKRQSCQFCLCAINIYSRMIT